jgi:hypothetical protein
MRQIQKKEIINTKEKGERKGERMKEEIGENRKRKKNKECGGR